MSQRDDDTSGADRVEFDEALTLALAESTIGPEPRGGVKQALLAHLAGDAMPPGFSVRLNADPDWLPHPVPGIRMKVLSVNQQSGYATLLLDVQPGTRYPAHHHRGAEECYVISGSILTLGCRLGPGDFIHADGDTDHEALYTDEGARVLLVVPASELDH